MAAQDTTPSPPSALVDRMQQFSIFTTNVWGADKVYKVMMYSARLASLALGSWQESEAFGEADPRLQLAVFAGDKALGGIADKLGEARYVLRFFGVVGWLVALARNPHRGEGGSTLKALLTDASSLSMLVFHPTDHAVWLSKAVPGVIGRGPIARMQLLGTRAACLFLAAQVALKLLALQEAAQGAWEAAARLRAVQPDPSGAGAAGSASPLGKGPPASSASPPSTPRTAAARREEAAGDLARHQASVRRIALSLLRYFLDFLTTLHYSVPGGVGLGPVSLNALPLLTSAIGAVQLWRSMFP